MARTPKRLFGPAALTGAAATKYTVPSVTKTIVRHIHAQNPSGAAVGFTLSIGADAAATRLFDAYSIPAAAPGVTGNILDHYCYYILEATEIIQSFASTATVIILTIDGDELTLG